MNADPIIFAQLIAFIMSAHQETELNARFMLLEISIQVINYLP